MKKLSINIASDLCLALGFIGWLICGIDGAKNLVLFVLWFLAVVGLIVNAIDFDQERFAIDERARSATGVAYRRVKICLIIAILAALGHVVLATVLLIAALLGIARREKVLKSQETASDA